MKKNIGVELSKALEDEFFIPECVNFTLQTRDNIDWSKMIYNNYYNSFQFCSKKFPNGWISIKGFDKVIEDIALQYTSPLQEMQNRQLYAFENIQLYSNLDNSEWLPLEEFNHIFIKDLKISKDI
jgi:hypothetical protein